MPTATGVAGRCLSKCYSTINCRPGYTCHVLGGNDAGYGVCWLPACTSSCDAGSSCVPFLDAGASACAPF